MYSTAQKYVNQKTRIIRVNIYSHVCTHVYSYVRKTKGVCRCKVHVYV